MLAVATLAGSTVSDHSAVRDRLVCPQALLRAVLCFAALAGPATRTGTYPPAREAAGAQTGTDAAPERDDPDDYAAIWAVPATPTLLFRYSAMTFNGHRFHYDQPYATQVEGYADLVVHGPMQATLLMNLAATLLGHVPRIFTYRGVSPMTANQTFRVCGRTRGSGFEGVTLDAAGKVCMRARADV